MHFLGSLFINAIVTMFFVGLAGSAIVILISFVEDFRELFGSDEPVKEVTAPPSTVAPPLSSGIQAR